VVIHEWRERKTGPGFPLMEVRCKTHGVHYTAYPPGYVPYGRELVAPTGPPKGAEEEGRSAWAGTLFAPALAEPWPDGHEFTGQTCWSTYRRHLGLSGAVLGLAGSVGLGEQAAAILAVPLHEQMVARRQFALGTVTGQRAGVAAALAALGATPRTWRQVVRAGYAAGVWGRPWFWNGRALEPLFPASEWQCVRTAREAGGSDP
jgi:hypothetical protein